MAYMNLVVVRTVWIGVEVEFLKPPVLYLSSWPDEQVRRQVDQLESATLGHCAKPTRRIRWTEIPCLRRENEYCRTLKAYQKIGLG